MDGRRTDGWMDEEMDSRMDGHPELSISKGCTWEGGKKLFTFTLRLCQSKSINHRAGNKSPFSSKPRCGSRFAEPGDTHADVIGTHTSLHIQEREVQMEG